MFCFFGPKAHATFGLQPRIEPAPLELEGEVFFQKIHILIYLFGCAGSLGSPHSSVGKESACNAGDAASIPGAGRSAGEGIGYPLQYSQASLVELGLSCGTWDLQPSFHHVGSFSCSRQDLSLRHAGSSSLTGD